MSESWAPYVGSMLGFLVGGSLVVAGLATQGIGLLLAIGALIGLVAVALLSWQAASLADESHA